MLQQGCLQALLLHTQFALLLRLCWREAGGDGVLRVKLDIQVMCLCTNFCRCANDWHATAGLLDTVAWHDATWWNQCVILHMQDMQISAPCLFRQPSRRTDLVMLIHWQNHGHVAMFVQFPVCPLQHKHLSNRPHGRATHVWPRPWGKGARVHKA